MLLGLVGLNGAGKTTFLRREYQNLLSEAAARQDVAYLPDNPVIPIEVPATELLQRIGLLRGLEHKESQRRAELLCRKLLIKNAHSQAVSAYSAGNYKKTALAVALMVKPDFLLLDEPLEAVDAVSSVQALGVLKGLSEAGTSIYISTQDLNIAMQCDVLRVFANLQVVAEGPPLEVLGEDPLDRLFTLSGVALDQSSLDWLS